MEARLDLRHRSAWIAETSVAFILVAVVTVVAEGPVHAQSAEARALFNDGIHLMAEGKLAQACDAFEASVRVEPGAGVLIRLGECREQNQQFASAWSAYQDALARAKDPRKRKFAKEKAAALEARLSYLTVIVSDGIRTDDLTITRNGKSFDSMLWNRAVPIDGGDYIIAGSAPGYEDWQTTVHVPAERAKVSVEVPKFKEVSKPISAPAPEPKPVSITERQDHEAVRPTGRFTKRRKIALGVAGASVIGVVAGVVLGESAKGKQNDAFKLCPHPATPCTEADQSNAFIKSSHSLALEANVAFGIAAAAAIGAGVLWFTGAPDAEHARRVSVVPSVVPGETSVVVMGRF